MSAPSTSGLSVELLLRVIDVKYGCFTLLVFFFNQIALYHGVTQGDNSKIQNAAVISK